MSQKKSKRELPIRAITLWTCAGILGIAVGIKFFRHPMSPIEIASTVKDGFSTPSDSTRMFSLLNKQKIHQLSDSEVQFLSKYAAVPKNCEGMVCGVLVGIDNESTAEKAIPIAQIVLNTGGEDDWLGNIRNAWRRDGCPVAADKLQAMLTAHNITFSEAKP